MAKKIKIFLFNCFFILIIAFKYVGIFGFLAYFTYVSQPRYNTLVIGISYGLRNDTSKNNSKIFFKTDSNLATYNVFKIQKIQNKIPMVKSYIVINDNNDIFMEPVYREPKFKFKGEIYDIEGKVIKDYIQGYPNETFYAYYSTRMISVIGDNPNFFEIFKMFENFDIGHIEYNGIRWDLSIYTDYRKNKFIIKLPIEINRWTENKIKFLKNNSHLCFDKNFTIIDLRFGNDKIYLVKA